MFGHTLFTLYFSSGFSLHWRKNLNNNVILCLFGANLRDIRDIITIDDEDEYLIQSKQTRSQNWRIRFSVSDLSSSRSQKSFLWKQKAFQRVTNHLFKAPYYHSMVHHRDMNMIHPILLVSHRIVFAFIRMTFILRTIHPMIKHILELKTRYVSNHMSHVESWFSSSLPFSSSWIGLQLPPAPAIAAACWRGSVDI